jgi:serine phosphatase RsbU (regulator of sigma subunit)
MVVGIVVVPFCTVLPEQGTGIPMSEILLSAERPPEDIRDLLLGAGFSIHDHVLGSVPPVGFSGITLAVIDVGNRGEDAALQTRRWRSELGDEIVPILWVVSPDGFGLAARGLDAGAHVVLARPLEPRTLLAQVRSAERLRATATRLAARAEETKILGAHLKNAHAAADREAAALRRVRLAFLERSFPEHGRLRAFVSHRPRGIVGGDFYDVVRARPERIAIVVGDAIGPGSAAGLIGHLAARMAARALDRAAQPAGVVLAEINRGLLELGLDELPLAAMLIAVFDPATGEVELARAGLPAPVYLPAAGAAERWPIPGPFLGTGDTVYATQSGVLHPGDRLLFGTDGIRPDGNPEPATSDELLAAAERNRLEKGQSFTDAVARELLAAVLHEEDFTLLVVEMAD